MSEGRGVGMRSRSSLTRLISIRQVRLESGISRTAMENQEVRSNSREPLRSWEEVSRRLRSTWAGYRIMGDQKVGGVEVMVKDGF